MGAENFRTFLIKYFANLKKSYQQLIMPKCSMWVRGSRHTLGSKNHTRKICNIPKDFELYEIFMHSFLCQNLNIPVIHITYLLEELTYFGLKVLKSFSLEVWAQFLLKNLYKKNYRYTQKILNYIVPKFSFHILFTHYPNYLLLD